MDQAEPGSSQKRAYAQTRATAAPAWRDKLITTPWWFESTFKNR